MEYFILDRIEGEFYILETDEQKYLSVFKTQIAPKAKEGDVLYLDDSGIYTVDEEKTKQRKEKLFRLQNSLFK